MTITVCLKSNDPFQKRSQRRAQRAALESQNNRRRERRRDQEQAGDKAIFRKLCVKEFPKLTFFQLWLHCDLISNRLSHGIGSVIFNRLINILQRSTISGRSSYGSIDRGGIL